ncbi:MAG: YicC/YloC family endoribonuclease, partial [Bacteroidota bacterium]
MLKIEGMIKSMTGYGKAMTEVQGKKYTAEARSLNSKQTDISVKIPGLFRDKEMEVRNYLSQKLERGKIDLFVSGESNGDVIKYSINQTVAKRYQ